MSNEIYCPQGLECSEYWVFHLQSIVLQSGRISDSGICGSSFCTFHEAGGPLASRKESLFMACKKNRLFLKMKFQSRA